MKDLNSAASLVKSISININGCVPMSTLSNRYFFGFGQDMWSGERIWNFYEKSTLFNSSVDATGGRQIHLPNRLSQVDFDLTINTTSLVFHRDEKDDEGRLTSVLAKKDFWMTNNILPVL